jgi:hypothetical protein
MRNAGYKDCALEEEVLIGFPSLVQSVTAFRCSINTAVHLLLKCCIQSWQKKSQTRSNVSAAGWLKAAQAGLGVLTDLYILIFYQQLL